ncbi:MAG TPA: class I SAM-dependent methyltransferase [Opitutaceae bacterium]
MPSGSKKICSQTVRADFNDLVTVVHYARAARHVGLWKSERLLIERFFPDRDAPLLEAGCGAGRVTLGLWDLGYRRLTAFDFAEELIDQARAFAAERNADAIHFFHADATRLTLPLCPPSDAKAPSPHPPASPEVRPPMPDKGFVGVLFMFNGLMQIPGREHRRAALRELHTVCAVGAPLMFTTHDRDDSRTERALWRLEAARWERGKQDPRLVEFGDRYFDDDNGGRTFMHLPVREEILEDLAATGWRHAFDAMRRELARESKAVKDFSDECRFWVAHRR